MRCLLLVLAFLPSSLWTGQERHSLNERNTGNVIISRETHYVSKRATVNFSNDEQELLKKAERINHELKKRLSKEAAIKNKFQEFIPEKKILGMDEAVRLYKIDKAYNNKNDLFLVFEGDLIIKKFDDAWISSQLSGMRWNGTLAGIIVTGNLTVEGDLIDGSQYSSVHVLKNLSCNYVFSHDGHIRVQGNADVRYGVYGEYNDGSFGVGGNLYTPYIIANDHDMPRSAATESIYIEAGNHTERKDVAVASQYTGTIGWGWDYFEDSQRLLSPKVWNENDEFSVDRFMDIVRQGENPFLNSQN